MAGKQAKTISGVGLRRMLAAASRSDHPARNKAIVLLSVKAGLRACEIARLDWSMVLDDRRRVGDRIELVDRAAKKRSGRRIPIHPELKRQLQLLARTTSRSGPVVASARGGPMRANSIVNWFVALFAELGMPGCSSHSGRRTFVTLAARSVHKAGGSLRDVQILAGHRSIETTQRYIDGDTGAQRRLIRYL